MNTCSYIHRCLYEGAQLCAVRQLKTPEIQRALDACCDELGIERLVYRMVKCQNCRLDEVKG